jgi:hypothetical protein
MADETILLPPPVEPIKLKDVLEELAGWKLAPSNDSMLE